MPVVSGAGVALTAQFNASAILLLSVVRNYKMEVEATPSAITFD